MQTIAIANQKGGVGKTTTAVTLGVCFAHAGVATTLLDLDPQANASSALLGGPSGVASALAGCPPNVLFPAAKPSPVEGLSVIPATASLRGWDAPEREDALRGQFAQMQAAVKEQTRILLVDCSPSLGPLVRTALRNSATVIAPVQCEYFAMEGLSQLVRTLDSLGSTAPFEKPALFLILTMHDPNLKLSSEVAAEVRRHFPDRTLRVHVPRDVMFSEASSCSSSPIEYDPTSIGTRSYIEIVREILYERTKGA